MCESFESKPMREAHLRYLLAAALVVVAGYGVYSAAPQQAGESPAESAATPTATPPGTATTAPPEQLAPGLTDEGVVDSWALSHAHANVLLNASFSVSSVETRWASDGSHRSRSAGYVQVTEGGTPLYFARDISGDDRGPSELDADVELWREENVSYARFVSENGTSYRESTPTQDILSGPITGWDAIYTLFTGTNTTTVERVERNATTLYRVVSTSQPRPGLSTRERSNYSLSALIDPSGLVHRYRVTYDAHEDGRTLHVARTWRLSSVGSTTVEQPGWLDEARNATAEREG